MTTENRPTPFREVTVSDDRCFIQLYGKEGATWEEMEASLERMYGNDKHIHWRGFGEPGNENFVVVVMRKNCVDVDCDCDEKEDDEEDEMCEACGCEEGIVHDWGCVRLCAECAMEGGEPHCPQGKGCDVCDEEWEKLSNPETVTE